ncbi:MAG: hydrogenase maturation protease [Acidobacteriota bacterium]
MAEPMSLALELTDSGYLHFPVDVARRYFPEDSLAPVVRDQELWLYPTRGAAGGGLILKQRNRVGDRSVLIWEVLPDSVPPGRLPAFWDDRQKVLRLALTGRPAVVESVT